MLAVAMHLPEDVFLLPNITLGNLLCWDQPYNTEAVWKIRLIQKEGIICY